MNAADIRRLVLGTLVSVIVVAAAALLSAWPDYRTLPPDQAVLKLSFTHGGDRSASCRDRTEEELAKLPANMRKTQVCERRRPPVAVELVLDGAELFAATLPPSGIAGDGPSRVYEKFMLPAGPHEIAVRMRDTPRETGFDHEAARSVTLAPGQNFVIDFDANAGDFVFK